jgi:hypothetical protein
VAETGIHCWGLMLSRVYESFTEGQDTADLRRGRALLDQLRRVRQNPLAIHLDQ